MSELPPPPPGSGLPPVRYPAGPPLAPPPPPAPPGTVRGGGSWPGPPEEQPVPHRRVSVWVVAVAIIVVGALLGGLFAVVVGDDADEPDVAADPFDRDVPPATEPPPTTDEPPPATTAPPTDLQAVVADIQAFVAAERGLPFLRDVTVELADDAEFEARLLEDFEEGAADVAVTGQVLQALGLVEPGTDLVAAFRSLLGAGVVGFYDPTTDELVVRGASASPYVRSVIAHELTHALDDQHFELDRPPLDDAVDESGFGFTAIVEGDASVVEAAYRATFTAEEENEAAEEEFAIGSEYDFDEIPLALFESIGAPYLLGPDLVEAILDAGGQAALDAAFVSPPTTSEHLLDPGTFVEGQAAVAVPPPAADGPEIDRHVLGAMGVAQVLGELSFIVSGFGGISDAVEGWGGDAYVAWSDGARVCVRANLVGDTPADTLELAEALEEWTERPPYQVEASVAVADVITLTSCG